MKRVKHHFSATLEIALTISAVVFSASAQSAGDFANSSSGEVRPNAAESQEDKNTRAEEIAARERGLVTAATTPVQCFTSGSPAGSTDDPRGITFMKVCITNRGNVSYFESPAGKVHIREREGYLVCSVGGIVNGFDAGIAADGWLNATVTQPNGEATLPLTITRETFDGKLRLTQTFTIIAASRELQIVMALRNISSAPIGFTLTRYFDADAEGTASDDQYDQTKDSVSAHQLTNSLPSLATGIILTEFSSQAPLHPAFDSQFFVEPFSSWNPNGTSFQSARRCLHGERAVGPTLPGDFVGRVIKPMGQLAPGQTRSVTFRYRRL